MAFPAVIELNVGGKHMTTLLSTLRKEPDSMLAAMSSERHVSKDKDDRFFIDCDGKMFHFITEFLRYGTVPPAEMALKVYDLASHFGIQSLVEKVEAFNAVQYRKRNDELKTSFGARQYEQLKHEVIKMMCNASPQENKVLRLIKKTCFYEHNYLDALKFLCPKQLLDIKDYVYIVVKTDCQITEEIKRCLAYDLCYLGYGNYCRTNIQDTVPRLCQVCDQNQKHYLAHDVILFLTHNFKTV